MKCGRCQERERSANGYCLPCRREYQKKYYSDHRDYFRKYNRDRWAAVAAAKAGVRADARALRALESEMRKQARERDPHWRFALRMRRYGITLEQYEAQFAAQGGVCAICGGAGGGKWWPLVIDHDHETGKFRGLLCDRCNRWLGFHEKWSAAAEAYLARAV